MVRLVTIRKNAATTALILKKLKPGQKQFRLQCPLFDHADNEERTVSQSQTTQEIRCPVEKVLTSERSAFTALTTRKRGGTQIAVWPVDRISTTVPLHCHDIREIRLDENVLAALLTHRITGVAGRVFLIHFVALIDIRKKGCAHFQ